MIDFINLIMVDKTLQPTEFIDFNNLSYLPKERSRGPFRDPLAVDIKEEPIIKEEPLENFAGIGNALISSKYCDIPIKQEPPEATDLDYIECSVMKSTAKILKEEPTYLGHGDIIKNEVVSTEIMKSQEINKLFSPDNSSSEIKIDNNHSSNVMDVEQLLKLDSNEVISFCKVSNKVFTGRRGGKYNINLIYSCFHCGYIAFQKTHIKVHIIAMHGGRKPYSCRICKLRFTQRGNLNYHFKSVHMKLKPYQCDNCDFTCSRKEDVKRHFSAVHDTFKPFACKECSYKTTRSARLNNHVKAVHRKVRPFLCTSCNYAASRKTHLDDHIIAKHTGIKKHICEKCPYKATQKSLLTRHINIHHQKEMIHEKNEYYECYYCHIAIQSKSILRKHIRMKHTRNNV